jgi:methylated-DNA-protein-cysteine methyltransferase-like protein
MMVGLAAQVCANRVAHGADYRKICRRVSILRCMPRPRQPTFELLLPLGAKRSRPRRPPSMADRPQIQALWDAICRIPRGRVSTYGEVARAAGLPGRARLAGFALKTAPADSNLPWHRVVSAGGHIAFPNSSAQHREQARRLRAEGVVLKNGRVDRAFIANLEES